ncbi:MAG: hypothetical protein JO232_02800 [Verrucomicrobia bacterium]|nr:hypothetical protein [Verrucomicrobiota bacterium]
MNVTAGDWFRFCGMVLLEPRPYAKSVLSASGGRIDGIRFAVIDLSEPGGSMQRKQLPPSHCARNLALRHLEEFGSATPHRPLDLPPHQDEDK